MKRELILLLVIAFIGGCTRKPASLQSAPEALPPVVHSGVPYAPADELPINRRNNQYLKEKFPGIQYPASEPYEYITYVGPSN